MDAKFQPSFIPKQPLTSSSFGRPMRVSLWYVIASIVFVVTLGLGGALFIVKRSLDQDIVRLNQELLDARASFELSTIAELKRVSARIGLAKTLLDKHLAVSKFLEALEKTTYGNIAFSNFSAAAADSGKVGVTLDGQSASYNALILQSDLFERLSFLQSPAFSNFALKDGGSVSFTFKATLDPSLISYPRYITEQ